GRFAVELPIRAQAYGLELRCVDGQAGAQPHVLSDRLPGARLFDPAAPADVDLGAKRPRALAAERGTDAEAGREGAPREVGRGDQQRVDLQRGSPVDRRNPGPWLSVAVVEPDSCHQ